MAVVSALLPALAARPVVAAERGEDLVGALEDYRASLERLLPLRERELEGANRAREQWRELLARGVLSRRELQDKERAAGAAQEKLEETRRDIAAADQALVEATAARALAGRQPLAPGGYERAAGLIRFNGPGTWSLMPDTARLRQFFASRFGRPLPVSALGQTPLHERMGFDHRDALDVAVHPDSAEGRALMDHLRGAGIPFIASWGALPGSASGAHIHVGQPSPRIAIRP